MNGDPHALTGAYAVDALDDLERARFERHLNECDDCRAEVDSLREATALLVDSAGTTPPPALRERVLAEAAMTRPLPPLAADVPPADVPESSSVGGRAARTSRRRWFPAAVAAAAAVVAVGAGGVVVWQPWGDDSSQTQRLTASERVLGAPDAESYTQTFPGGARATITVSDQLNQAVVADRRTCRRRKRAPSTRSGSSTTT